MKFDLSWKLLNSAETAISGKLIVISSECVSFNDYVTVKSQNDEGVHFLTFYIVDQFLFEKSTPFDISKAKLFIFKCKRGVGALYNTDSVTYSLKISGNVLCRNKYPSRAQV